MKFAGSGPDRLTLTIMRNSTRHTLSFYMVSPPPLCSEGMVWGGFEVRILPSEMGTPHYFFGEEGHPPLAVLAAGTVSVSLLLSLFTQSKKEAPQALRILLGPISDEVVREFSPNGPNEGLVEGWLEWPLEENRFRLALSLVGPFPSEKIGSEGKKEGIGANSDSLRMIRQLRREMKSMRESLNHCSLTGLLNRRGIEEKLGLDWQECEGLSLKFALLMIDVDHFKAVNDQYLHPAGDQVLVDLGKHLSLQLRAGDSLGRMGGEEFWILAPNTDTKGAGLLAQRLCESVVKHPFVVGEAIISITISVGVSVLQPEPQVDSVQLYHQAALALRWAKQSGRNCIKVHDLAMG